MNLLLAIGDTLREWMMAVPLSVVRGAFVGLLVLVLVWVWRLPASVTSPPQGATRWDENLKLGATLALVVQIVVYSLL